MWNTNIFIFVETLNHYFKARLPGLSNQISRSRWVLRIYSDVKTSTLAVVLTYDQQVDIHSRPYGRMFDYIVLYMGHIK